MTHAERLHALDAVRAFALLLGVALHASLSFVPGMPPGIWAMVDNSPSAALGGFFFVVHIFRMSLFFLVAGFFARLLYQRSGAKGFWTNRGRRIAVPLVVGWCVVFPAIALVWGWGLAKVFGGSVPVSPPEFQMPADYFPLTHLWFLYYLLLLYPVLLLARAALVRLDRGGALRARIDTAWRGLVGSRAAPLLLPLVLGAPLALMLYQLPFWSVAGGIPTPDSSLIPRAVPMVGYGTAMAAGWLLHRHLDLLQALERQWIAYGLLAVATTLYLASQAGGIVAPPLMGQSIPKAQIAGAYVFALWTWSLAILGCALRFLSGESALRRYVADSSYWLYIAHLPVVAAFGVLVGHWPLHWSVKFPLVLGASLALLFASYHYLVRPTFVGEWLNGRRYPRGARGGVPAATAAADEDPRTVARLAAATRRYGSTVALDGVDLAIDRGELVALLGPNGAGKSSAISLWLGLAEPDTGRAALLGGSPLDVERRRGIGVMMQDVTLAHGMRVRELIEQTASYYPDPLGVDETLALTQTAALANRLYDKLSGGQKRQVQFALAVCGRPAVLFLDEPTVGLDVTARETMWAAIRRLRAEGCSILLTTHYLEEAEALADRVIVLAKGRVVASGSVSDVRSIVSRRQIRCDSGIAEEELATWPGVIAVSRQQRRLTIMTADAEGVLRRLLGADPGVANLEVQQAGLAEAFVELTKEAA